MYRNIYFYNNRNIKIHHENLPQVYELFVTQE